MKVTAKLELAEADASLFVLTAGKMSLVICKTFATFCSSVYTPQTFKS